MAITSKITRSVFEDDANNANIKTLNWLIYDNTLTNLDNNYTCGFISYDFVNDSVVAQGIKSLAEAATIKTAIEAIKLDKAKDGTYFTANPLPTLVSSTTVKDGAGVVTSYTEEY